MYLECLKVRNRDDETYLLKSRFSGTIKPAHWMAYRDVTLRH